MKLKNETPTSNVRDIDSIEKNEFFYLFVFKMVFNSNLENIESVFGPNGRGREAVKSRKDLY